MLPIHAERYKNVVKFELIKIQAIKHGIVKLRTFPLYFQFKVFL
jgi:hypothetical protein